MKSSNKHTEIAGVTVAVDKYFIKPGWDMVHLNGGRGMREFIA